MMIIHPLMGSQQSADFRQSWQLSGVWRRSINLVAEGGALLTLHRQGSGVHHVHAHVGLGAVAGD